jgi:hypothetical protein
VFPSLRDIRRHFACNLSSSAFVPISGQLKRLICSRELPHPWMRLLSIKCRKGERDGFSRSIWRVVYDQGYGRPQTVEEYAVEAQAFDAARSWRNMYRNVPVEDPEGQLYDEAAVSRWFQKRLSNKGVPPGGI